MRRFAAVIVAVVLLAARGSTAGPPKDFVAGGGQHLAFGTGPDIVHFGVTAHSGPVGEDPTGSMTFQIAGSPALHADVTCLMVVGNTAIATGIFTQPESVSGQIVVGEFVDNNNPSDPRPDQIRFSFAGFIEEVTPPPGVSGPCFVPVLPPVDVIRGNIVVNDAQP
jgi:hypothetical protein